MGAEDSCCESTLCCRPSSSQKGSPWSGLRVPVEGKRQQRLPDTCVCQTWGRSEGGTKALTWRHNTNTSRILSKCVWDIPLEDCETALGIRQELLASYRSFWHWLSKKSAWDKEERERGHEASVSLVAPLQTPGFRALSPRLVTQQPTRGFAGLHPDHLGGASKSRWTGTC